MMAMIFLSGQLLYPCWPLGVVIAITSECSDDSVIIPAQELQSPANGKFMSV